MHVTWTAVVFGVAVLAPGTRCPEPAGRNCGMTFFVTSVGSGNGADLGGLAGADAHCQQLAQAAGAGGTWRAYLSTQAADGQPAVNARERIGSGPWQNAQGVVIATSVEELHGQNNLTKATALTEEGQPVNGRGDSPNMHDILTGSQPTAPRSPGPDDMTCGNWTRSGADGGGHGRAPRPDRPARRRALQVVERIACLARRLQPDSVAGTGGAGLFYCFAAE